MEAVLAAATILGGIAALWYFWERIATLFKSKPKGAPIAQTQRAAAPLDSTVHRHRPFFLDEPINDLSVALAEAKKRELLVFTVIFDETHPQKSRLTYSLGCFMDYHTTKKLVQEHFVVLVGPASDPELRKLVPGDNPLENCLWVVLSPDGEILRREGVYANADEGLKRVRQVIKDFTGRAV